MIYHQRATVNRYRLDRSGVRELIGTTVVPCELVPINSIEAAGVTGAFVTRYTFVCPVNIDKLPGSEKTVTVDGEELSFEARFEVHRVAGRFHHIEGIVVDT